MRLYVRVCAVSSDPCTVVFYNEFLRTAEPPTGVCAFSYSLVLLYPGNNVSDLTFSPAQMEPGIVPYPYHGFSHSLHEPMAGCTTETKATGECAWRVHVNGPKTRRVQYCACDTRRTEYFDGQLR